MTAQQFTTSEAYEHKGYCPGHPWYYFLGGRPRRPREILEDTRQSGYQGYAREDIKTADAMAEPKRSKVLRALQSKFRDDLKRDLSRYRQCVRDLRAYRIKHGVRSEGTVCDGVHVALSLKHSHMVNNFGHLIYLDELLTRQRDLFDF
jgi:hypothetical protein